MARFTRLRNFILLCVALLIRDAAASGVFGKRILPTELEVQEGEDIQVRLTESLGGNATCRARTPLLVNCDLKVADDDYYDDKNVTCPERVHYWSYNGGCGFYIIGVQKEDAGSWRLTSQDSDGKKVVDTAIITVLDQSNGNTSEAVEITRGMTYNLTFSDVNECCIMQNPYDPFKTLLNNVCSVDIETVSAADSGTWEAIVGVPGQVKEAVKTSNVSVFYEHVHSGYTISSDSKAIHMYCNYVALDKSVNICRFSRGGVNKVGLRLRDGARKGRYEYYGNGLNEGECGLTIRSPEEEDYAPWYCLIKVPDKSPIITPISVLKSSSTAPTSAVSSTNSPVIAVFEDVLRLECYSSVPLRYCWFAEPSGTLHRPTIETDMMLSDDPRIDPQIDTYWFGKCVLVLEPTRLLHNGTWTCHMGPAVPGVEIVEEIQVRVTSSRLAALENRISSNESRITFDCKTVPHAMTLVYCRFKMPSGLSIHLDHTVTESNPIELDGVRYWYSGKSLAAGDCGLTFEPAKNTTHDGTWRCAATIELLPDDEESYDTIVFKHL